MELTLDERRLILAVLQQITLPGAKEKIIAGQLQNKIEASLAVRPLEKAPTPEDQ